MSVLLDHIYLLFTTRVILGQGVGNGLFQTRIDYSKTIKSCSGECGHLYIIVGLRMVNWLEASHVTGEAGHVSHRFFGVRSFSCSRPFQAPFRYLQVNLVQLCSSVPGKQGRPGEVDSKTKSRPPRKFSLPSLRSLIGADLPYILG